MRCKFETEPKINTFEIKLIVQVAPTVKDPEMYICELMEALHRNCMYTIKTAEWVRVSINTENYIQMTIYMETVSDYHNEEEAAKEIKGTIEKEFQYFLMWRKKHGHEEPAVIDCISMETAVEREAREKQIKEEEEREKKIRSEMGVREAWEMHERVYGNRDMDELALRRQYQEMYG